MASWFSSIQFPPALAISVWSYPVMRFHVESSSLTQTTLSNIIHVKGGILTSLLLPKFFRNQEGSVIYQQFPWRPQKLARYSERDVALAATKGRAGQQVMDFSQQRSLWSPALDIQPHHTPQSSPTDLVFLAGWRSQDQDQTQTNEAKVQNRSKVTEE